MSESHTTTDHKKIKKWAEDRKGVPATVKATEDKGHAGILRIDFCHSACNIDPLSRGIGVQN
ncbi:MAG: hypothetical protein V7608_6006 [Hyphomicrobiales bacterium]|jgi:hypothetical protein